MVSHEKLKNKIALFQIFYSLQNLSLLKSLLIPFYFDNFLNNKSNTEWYDNGNHTNRNVYYMPN